MTINDTSTTASAGPGLSDGLGPVVPRWYCMTRDGLTTLCANERDARRLAAECDQDFPKNAPHRAVLLGDVAAERGRIRGPLRVFAADIRAAAPAMAEVGLLFTAKEFVNAADEIEHLLAGEQI